MGQEAKPCRFPLETAAGPVRAFVIELVEGPTLAGSGQWQFPVCGRAAGYHRGGLRVTVNVRLTY